MVFSKTSKEFAKVHSGNNNLEREAIKKGLFQTTRKSKVRLQKFNVQNEKDVF